jgi:hypothetical protein
MAFLWPASVVGFQNQWRFEKNNDLKFFSIGIIKDGEEKGEFRPKTG